MESFEDKSDKLIARCVNNDRRGKFTLSIWVNSVFRICWLSWNFVNLHHSSYCIYRFLKSIKMRKFFTHNTNTFDSKVESLCTFSYLLVYLWSELWWVFSCFFQLFPKFIILLDDLKSSISIQNLIIIVNLIFFLAIKSLVNLKPSNNFVDSSRISFIQVIKCIYLFKEELNY